MSAKSTDKNKYTPQQEAAINYRGGTLLVSSAAGSGKTMVLVERLLGYISGGSSIDDFLVITYTRAAAAELRERIYNRLRQELAIKPGNMHLRRQSMLCTGANIDTIHTYCSNILRENAHIAGLAPDFRVADESESKLIKNEVLSDVFDRTYEVVDTENTIKELLEMTVEGRDDRFLMQIVLEIHEKLGSIPDADSWIDSALEELRGINGKTDISQTLHGRYMLAIMKARLDHCLGKMLRLREETLLYPDFAKSYGANINEIIKAMETLLVALDTGWDEAAARAGIDISKPKPVSGYDELKAVRKQCLDELTKINKNLKISSAEHIADAKQILPAIEGLMKLVLDFDEAYGEEKKKRGVVDFSDLEHMALSLLFDKKTGKKTPIANAVSKRFTEILIDEYQDVNEVQEMIFRALSKDGGNIFMVGDVKQSIYRFRLADPSIFLGKYREFAPYTPDNDKKAAAAERKPVRINLSSNFRSQPEILEAVNHIFKNIMSVQFGEMDYTDEEALVPGRAGKQGNQGKKGKQGIEVDLISAGIINEREESEQGESAAAMTAVEIEASHVAARIKEMVNDGYMTSDGNGQPRPLAYSDIAILSRSIKGTAWKYARALSNIGIPSQLPDSESYFEQIEVQAALSLLTVIDNPMQDIPLAALLSGPVYSLTSDELAQIRLCAENGSNTETRDGGFYEALKSAAQSDNMPEGIAQKCKNILADLDEMRSRVSDLPADRFIWHAYNKTELLKKISIYTESKKRIANLHKLAELAQNYEKNGYKGVFGFLCYIKALRERGEDITDSPESGQYTDSGEGAVKILTIHKSKGLEFPVVFMVSAAKKHNMTDLYKPFVFHKTLGIGAMITDTERRIKYTTLARAAISEKLKQELLSEELRVLYVAMTRAREKLIITAAFNDAESTVKKIKALAGPDGKYSPQSLMSMNSAAHWIIAGLSDCGIDAGNRSAAIKIYDKQEPGSGDGIAAPAVQGTSPDAAAPDFSFAYPYSASVNLPSKLTVTGLLSSADTGAENAPWTYPDGSMMSNIRKPRFMQGGAAMTAAEKGTLLHNVMRYIDLEKSTDVDGIQKELRRIEETELIDPDEMKQIGKSDIEKISALLNSDIGAGMRKAASQGKLEREFKFSLLAPAARYFDNCTDDDEILLQGIIDCFFEENGEITVVDFKTDRIDGSNLGSKVKKYTPQLEAYSEALEEITGKPVKERVLYFLSAGKAVSV